MEPGQAKPDQEASRGLHDVEHHTVFHNRLHELAYHNTISMTRKAILVASATLVITRA